MKQFLKIINTSIPAFIETFTKGGDGFETDLRTSKDGYIVSTQALKQKKTTIIKNQLLKGSCSRLYS